MGDWNATLPASFCEGKLIPYLVPDVYEFFNALSGAVLIFMGTFGILQPRLEMIIKMTYAGIIISGIGTIMMHWKRIEIFNLADTFPLLVTLAFGLTAFFDTLVTILKVRRFQRWSEASLQRDNEMLDRQETIMSLQQPTPPLHPSFKELLETPRQREERLQQQQQQQRRRRQGDQQQGQQGQQPPPEQRLQPLPSELSITVPRSPSPESEKGLPDSGWKGTLLIALECFIYVAMLAYLVTGLILVVYSTFDKIFGFYFGIPYGFFAIGGAVFLYVINPHRSDPVFKKLIPVMSLAIFLGLLSVAFKLVDTDACNEITVWLFPHALFHILVTYSAHCFLVCLSFHRVYQATLGIGLKPDVVWKGFVFPYLVLPPTDAINLSVLLKKNLSETHDLMARNRMVTILTV